METYMWLHWIIMQEYYLIKFPTSQHFMDNPECYQCIDDDSAYFVPVEIYEEYINNQYINLWH